MATFNPNLLLLSRLTRNTELLNLFKQMAFLIHRNTYGGLNIHDLQALSVIKKRLTKLLDEPEKEYLTKLIDSLSLYDLPEVVSSSMTNKLLETEVFDYVARQASEDLCDILIEHSPRTNGLLLSIEIKENTLALVSDLVEFAKENAPDKMTDLELKTCNVWEVIKNAKDLPDNHIHIAFVTQPDESTNFLCFKGLCIAKNYLEFFVEEPVEKKVKEREKKPFMPTFSYGMTTLARKITGKKLNSNVVTVRNVSDVQETKKKKGLGSLFKIKSKAAKETELVAAESLEYEDEVEYEDNEEATSPVDVDVIDDEYDDSNDTQLKGIGFFDIEQGFLFNVTSMPQETPTT